MVRRFSPCGVECLLVVGVHHHIGEQSVLDDRFGEVDGTHHRQPKGVSRHKGNVGGWTSLFNRRPGGVVHQTEVLHDTFAGMVHIGKGGCDQEELAGLSGLHKVEQRADIKSQFKGLVGFCGISPLHIFAASLPIENVEFQCACGPCGVGVVGNSRCELEHLAARMGDGGLEGDLRENLVPDLYYIDALVPNTTLCGQGGQPGIGQVTVTVVAELFAVGVADDDGADFPVTKVHNAIPRDIDVVGVLAVIVVIPADIVVVADNGHRMVYG